MMECGLPLVNECMRVFIDVDQLIHVAVVYGARIGFENSA